MTELERTLVGASAAAPPSRILEALPDRLAVVPIAGAPHTIYQELWHITFWQQVTLDWVNGVETPCPLHNDLSFPEHTQIAVEPWAELCGRFFAANGTAGRLASDAPRLDTVVRCPSPPGHPVRLMTVREQLESLTAHNAYHFGRIVLLRQILGSWPPPSGGFSW